MNPSRHTNFVLRLSSFVIFLIPTLACSLLAPHPKVEWNPAADSVVIEATISGGMLYEPNPMPVARLWGDGRLIWAVSAPQGGRQVQYTTLTPDQMRKLLQTFEDDGFFGWKDSYSPGVVYDAAATCLSVQLTGTSKSVCEIVSGAPAQFDELFALLASGGGGSPAQFVPERGYLRVTPFESPVGAGTLVVAWPGDQLNLRLADLSSGQWVEGDALRLAWSVVNANPLNPLVRDGERGYQLQLYVPDVMGIAPT